MSVQFQRSVRLGLAADGDRVTISDKTRGHAVKFNIGRRTLYADRFGNGILFMILHIVGNRHFIVCHGFDRQRKGIGAAESVAICYAVDRDVGRNGAAVCLIADLYHQIACDFRCINGYADIACIRKL